MILYRFNTKVSLVATNYETAMGRQREFISQIFPLYKYHEYDYFNKYEKNTDHEHRILRFSTRGRLPLYHSASFVVNVLNSRGKYCYICIMILNISLECHNDVWSWKKFYSNVENESIYYGNSPHVEAVPLNAVIVPGHCGEEKDGTGSRSWD